MRPNLHATLTLRSRIAACLLTGACALPGATGAAVILDPFLAGQFAEGTGANATFLKIDDAWQETKVYWKEPGKSEKVLFSNKDLPSYGAIAGQEWGTGIWGLVDWRTLSALPSDDPLVEGFWTGRVAQINQGDAQYQECYTNPVNGETEPRCRKWGAADELPSGFFATGSTQNNWISHYTGYIRISDPGEYNFGVLYDDGFFLKIWGANGAVEEISSDFLSPRDRKGFDYDLLLGTGLYRFELGAYDRLEVGVVNLGWSVNGGNWTTVPTENLVDRIQIPTPGTAALLVAGLGALVAVRMKRKRG